MKNISRVLILAPAFWMVLIRWECSAAEERTGHYVPGVLADFGYMAPCNGAISLAVLPDNVKSQTV